MKLLSLQTKELEMNLDKKKIQIFARRWSFLLVVQGCCSSKFGKRYYGLLLTHSSEFLVRKQQGEIKHADT